MVSKKVSKTKMVQVSADDVKVGDSVKICGGKHKHCVGVLRELKNTFCKVEVTRNIKKDIAFNVNNIFKVKKSFLEHWKEDLIIEMPSSSDLKVVDHFPEEEPSLLNIIDKAIKDKTGIPTDIVEKTIEILNHDSPPLKEGECITEKHVIETAITMSDAEKWRDECLKLREEVGTYRLLRFAEIPQMISDLAQVRVDYARLYEECDHKDKEIHRLAKFTTEIKKVVSEEEN
jgi:hypothetical protein